MERTSALSAVESASPSGLRNSRYQRALSGKAIQWCTPAALTSWIAPPFRLGARAEFSPNWMSSGLPHPLLPWKQCDLSNSEGSKHISKPTAAQTPGKERMFESIRAPYCFHRPGSWTNRVERCISKAARLVIRLPLAQSDTAGAGHLALAAMGRRA
jgi:hypothetical protein